MGQSSRQPLIIIRQMSSLLERLFHTAHLTDSALPVGGFSFSNALEAAIAEGVVSSAKQLSEIVESYLDGVATTDGVAALVAWQHACNGDMELAANADTELWLRRVGDEAMRQSLTMGRKLTQLSLKMGCKGAIEWWAAALDRGDIRGCYSTSLGVLFSSLDIGREWLFSSLIYGAANQMLSAALRLMRLSHFETQRILYGLARRCLLLYERVDGLDIDQMQLFAPELEILSSLHEQGEGRLFMS